MSDNEKKIAIVLLSGGLDSTTVLYLAIELDFFPLALSFEYNQRHLLEIQSAHNIVKKCNCIGHTIIKLDSSLFRGSALVGKDIDLPSNRIIDESIPVTYVPARNIVFLSQAAALAESLAIQDIFIGINSLDYSGYPDCRPEFIMAFEKMLELGMKTGVEGKPVKIHSPLINMSKGEIIREGLRLGIDYSLTSSCYDPGENGKPCTCCDSCLLREKGFAEAGIRDPLIECYSE